MTIRIKKEKTIKAKTCTKCQEILPAKEFHLDASKIDGLRCQCRRCRAAYQKTEAGKSTSSKATKKYQLSPAGKATRKKHMKKWRRSKAGRESREKYCQKNLEKIKARMAVSHAVTSGKLVRPETCSECGRAGKVHGHHENYNRQLDVSWLCRDCHAARHQELKKAA